MSYANENLQTWISATDDLAATGDASADFKVTTPVTIYAVGIFCTTALVGTTGVVAYDISQPNGASYSRGDGDLTTLQVVANTSVGRVIKKLITPVDLDPGDFVTPQVTTALGTSGTGFHFIVYRQREEVAGNLSAVVVSA